MELFFRKYFWTVNLLFVLLVALLAAKTVNLFVESAISPVPTSGAAARAPANARPAQSALALPDMEQLSRVTGIKIPEPEVAVAEPTAPQVDPNAAPVKSGLRVKLLGTLVAGNPDWSFASIQDMVTQRSQTYMVGNALQGATVLEIERERVIVLNGGRKEFIDGNPGDGAQAFTPPTPPVAQANTASTSGIRAVSDNEYEVPRAEIDKTLNNLNDVAMQARIVPAFKDGQAVGFKLFSIRPDSIYSKIGVQNGDVIRRINGFDLNSPEKALEVYSKMKDSSRIEIEIERNGAPIRKSYNVR
ncbi:MULTISPECIES: type II secretion system protein GspC [Myxococcus]|uniref:General secretion pathway protein GspC n=1 Tax=Myxococcus llanfairpwllgwyngyllgogerychwyrndrobwllllantysiliogogogochensis TaxID=2590453 RepID=A0A540WP77_9BACT|nr:MULTISPECIES: type II secretion system protein GspC [Myxococcus]NTX04221.1 general secretion pathway protein GspC [Myxococcus sp. CA040A]TQF10833.1 general secretion pathway protein GspC [Myxococcus llanfairpwllgwyngyllgogerychwyrndrobwllllantysiliogogogochensis]